MVKTIRTHRIPISVANSRGLDRLDPAPAHGSSDRVQCIKTANRIIRRHFRVSRSSAATSRMYLSCGSDICRHTPTCAPPYFPETMCHLLLLAHLRACSLRKSHRSEWLTQLSAAVGSPARLPRSDMN